MAISAGVKNIGRYGAAIAFVTFYNLLAKMRKTHGLPLHLRPLGRLVVLPHLPSSQGIAGRFSRGDESTASTGGIAPPAHRGG